MSHRDVTRPEKMKIVDYIPIWENGVEKKMGHGCFIFSRASLSLVVSPSAPCDRSLYFFLLFVHRLFGADEDA